MAAEAGGDNPLNKHLVAPLTDFGKKGVKFIENVRAAASATCLPVAALVHCSCQVSAPLPRLGVTVPPISPCAVPQAQAEWYVISCAVLLL